MVDPSTGQGKYVYMDINSHSQRKTSYSELYRDNYGDVRAHAQIYQDKGTREA